MIAKTDRKRIDTAIRRHVDRFKDAEQNGTTDQVLAAALDWLRAEVKIIDRCFDGDDWGETYRADAARCIHGLAVKAAEDIMKELE